MARKHKIRWQESDNEELKRAVRNFNSKLDRIAKKNPEIKNALPDKASVKQLRELINTRQDLQREINSLKRFNKKRGFDKDKDLVTYGDYNIQMTKWQRSEINRRVAVINRRRKERLEALEGIEVTSRGEAQGFTRGEYGIGKAEFLELSPMQGLTPGMNQRDLNKKFQNVLIQSQSDFYTLKDYRAKANYITGLKQNFNEEDVKEIIEKIESMPLDEFLNTFNSDNDAKFEGLYAPNQKQYGKYVRSLKAVWIPNR